MKRSEINAAIAEFKEFLAEHRFHLPPWAFWAPEDWQGKRETCGEIAEAGLGWDVTDFSKGDFRRFGLTVFTVRNGIPGSASGKTYCEKVMMVWEDQETPMHFHWSKVEDIINRGGGNLVLELYSSTPDEELGDAPLPVSVDGVRHIVKPGGQVILKPGESITLEQGMYHRFFAEPGKGKALIGEVSRVNDDAKDNRFHEGLGRYPELIEDEGPLHVLCSEYDKFMT